MKKKELEKLIDTEVSKVFINLTSKEPQIKKSLPQKSYQQPQINLTEEELDEILFYGGKRPGDEM
jgi:hypothetical protein